MYPPVHLEAEPDDDRHSWLVFITSGLASHEITASLDRFLRHAPTAVVDLPGATVELHSQAAGPAAKAQRTALRGRHVPFTRLEAKETREERRQRRYRGYQCQHDQIDHNERKDTLDHLGNRLVQRR